MVLYVGSIIGGASAENDAVVDGVRKLNRLAKEVRDQYGERAEFVLDLVFHIPGPLLQLPYKGLRTGSLFGEQHTLQVQVAVPEDLGPDAVGAFLDDALRQAVGLAERSLRRRKLAWSVEPLRAAVEEVIARRRSDP